ncbi:MAG: enoyl-CoA hydratase/isomerase family protein [Myxococcota bacterium]
MADQDYDTLTLRREGAVAIVTIDHPPINLRDLSMMRDLGRLGQALEADASVHAAVFRSADPDYFIAHADVELIQKLPSEPQPKPTEVGGFHAMVERFRTMPVATIGMVEGRARGGGSEFLLSLDMRFAAAGRALFGQPEVALGILPGGSGTQRLPRLMGRARALEAILGCGDFDAETAERYGWVNRALPPDELEPFVMDLARRIASFPKQAIAKAKASVDAAETTTPEGLIEEAHLFNQTLGDPETKRRLQAFLDAGGQQRENELAIGRLFDALVDPA